MIAATRPVAVEVRLLHAVLDEVLSGGAVGGNRARGRDVAGCHRVAEYRERASTVDVGQVNRTRREVVEVRRFLDVRGVGIPLEDGTGGRRHLLPVLVAVEDA